MKYKKPYIATLEEVTIMRDGEIAVIRYKDKSVAGVNLKIGKEIEFMSDQVDFSERIDEKQIPSQQCLISSNHMPWSTDIGPSVM